MIGLDGCAQGHNFVGVEIRQRRLAEKIRHRCTHLGHSRGAAHQHHALDIRSLQARIAQGFAHRLQGARGQVLGSRVKLATVDGHIDTRSTQADFNRRNVFIGQSLFASAGGLQ